MKYGLNSLAAMVVAAAFVGCSRCEDRGEAAMHAMLLQLTQGVVSNLVHEASVCIANSLSQSVGPYYSPPWADTPVARSLKPEAGSEATFSMGPDIVVHTRGASAPYMSVRVPVHPGAGVCIWEVIICVKSGGGFAKGSAGWTLEGRGTNTTPIVEVSDEVLVYAEIHGL